MAAHSFNPEKDNARFFLSFKRVLVGFVILMAILLTSLTDSILSEKPQYMQDWRGVTCITLVVIAFLIYALPMLRVFGSRKEWPPSLAFGISVWCILYAMIMILTLIDIRFSWAFYVVFGVSFGLFHGWHLILSIAAMTATMLAFQLDLSGAYDTIILSIMGQVLPIFSIMSFTMLFQNLIAERFERNKLVEQLTEANAELASAHSQLEQSAEQAQELAVLRERTRLAREMHDTIGHALVLISVKLEAAQRLRARDPERCDHELDSTKEIARSTMTALRSSIANLRSPTLAQDHIYHALRQYAGEMTQRTGLQVNCALPLTKDELPEAHAETLWKISQEALANIEKHARAKQVQITIQQCDEHIHLKIEDDGVGLSEDFCQRHRDGSFTRQGHYGLRGILERAEALHGTLTLHSQPGQGTVVEVALPIR